MYYNVNSNEILSECPANGYLPIQETIDGIEHTRLVLIQGLNISDPEIQKLCGILIIKKDEPVQPPNTYEDINQRIIIQKNDGVYISRTYIPYNTNIIPESVSARQVRLWLIDNNIALSNVEAAINTIEDMKLREKTKIEWEYAPYIERTHPLVNSLAQYLGLSHEQIDQGFIDASKL